MLLSVCSLRPENGGRRPPSTHLGWRTGALDHENSSAGLQAYSLLPLPFTKERARTLNLYLSDADDQLTKDLRMPQLSAYYSSKAGAFRSRNPLYTMLPVKRAGRSRPVSTSFG